MELFLGVNEKVDRSMYEVYINDLINPDANTRVQAAHELGKAKIHEALEFLKVKVWEDEASLVKVTALQSVYMIMEEEALQEFIPTVLKTHPDHQVRFFAAKLLGDSHSPKVLNLLESHYEHEQAENVKEMILYAIARIANKKSKKFMLRIMKELGFEKPRHLERVIEYFLNTSSNDKQVLKTSKEILENPSLTQLLKVKAATLLALNKKPEGKAWLQEHLKEFDIEIVVTLNGKKYRGERGIKKMLGHLPS